jgi:hypothetical protein
VTGILEQCGPRKRVTTSVTAFKTEAVNTPETQKNSPVEARPERVKPNNEVAHALGCFGIAE